MINIRKFHLKFSPLTASVAGILAISFFFAACKKDDQKPPVPTLSGFSPGTDTAGAQIVITGSNFSATSSLDIVEFNGVVATVVSASPTQLTVIVPDAAKSGAISVSVNGQTASSSNTFTVVLPTLPPPILTSFTPALIGTGYPVTITGLNFSPDSTMNSVTINGAPAKLISSSKTQLVAVVPEAAASGKIVVTIKDQKVTSTADIVVVKLVVTTLAGIGTSGDVDGPANTSSFNGAWSANPDGNGNYYISDPFNNKIRKLTAGGTVSTFAGTGSFGYTNGNTTTAKFGDPYDMAFDHAGNMFVTDIGLNNIRKIAPDGTVSNFVGDIYGNSGTVDGTGSAARFNVPMGIVIDDNDNLYVVDGANNKIRKITPAGVVTTFAGSGSPGSADGNGTTASFKGPYSIAMDAGGNFYVTDEGNDKIRKITPAGDVSTFAGTGVSGSGDGPAASATFSGPAGIAVDPAGNVWISDNLPTIRMISTTGMVYTLAGNGVQSSVDGSGGFASFSNPQGISIDASGTMIVVDNGTNKIRKVVLQ
jgi:hypothetical protein